MGLTGSAAHSPGPVEVKKFKGRGGVMFTTKEEAEESMGNKFSHLFSMPAFRFAVGDVSKAIGKWSRTCTYGDKSAKGEGLAFNAETMGELIRNAAARSDKIAIDEDHKTAFVSETGQAAPSLGYFYAMALFDNGQLLDHWAKLTMGLSETTFQERIRMLQMLPEAGIAIC